jgi:hypothetical protein
MPSEEVVDFPQLSLIVPKVAGLGHQPRDRWPPRFIQDFVCGARIWQVLKYQVAQDWYVERADFQLSLPEHALRLTGRHFLSHGLFDGLQCYGRHPFVV